MVSTRRRWTADEDDQLRYLVRCGWSVRRIAGVLNRGIYGVYIRARVRYGGIDHLRRGIFAVRCAQEVATLLNIPTDHVRLAIREGWLRAHRNYGRTGRRTRWLRFLIGDDALEDFLADSRWWMLWTPEKITDSDWRNHAEEVRGGVRGRWLSVADIARRDGTSERWAQRRIKMWADEGRRVQRVANRWYLWEGESEGTQDMGDAQWR